LQLLLPLLQALALPSRTSFWASSLPPSPILLLESLSLPSSEAMSLI
jgi:hypothetical protein